MRLETERLILRDFVADDWQRVIEYQTDPLYLRYYEWTTADRTPEAVQEFVGWFLDHQKQEPRIKFQLAIVLKSDNLLIGNCGIRKDRANAFQADIGYELDPSYWNRGYATEAIHAIVDFGFSTLSLHRVWAWCVADNIGSTHVMEKLGMQLEGRLRENEYYKDRWWDMLMYAILLREWEEHKQSRPVPWIQTE
ncbi:MAG TPA: GNAT family protein [Anaerolineales bacterium]|nr:GNAT family protein [Anaerolineales bacterium]